ncbi:hypothetical protein ACPPVO_24520 [Dactylosporangium sp. McL0621]|uniref:hypothetical protein n=1 Tax=Dactylosporangium sp. McL0621 TaxID=3415678 RepID=UPI003CF5590C
MSSGGKLAGDGLDTVEPFGGRQTLARAIAALIAACLLFTAWSGAAPKPVAALDPFTGCLMAYFTGESATAQRIYFVLRTK